MGNHRKFVSPELIVVLLFFAFTALGASDDNFGSLPAGNLDFSSADIAEIVTEAELQVDETEFNYNKSSIEKTSSFNQILFQCNAWPVTNQAMIFYWIHWDPSVAAKTAVNVCWSRTYLPCTYWCFRVR